MHTNQRNSRLKSYGPESKNLRLISIICTSRNEFFLHRLIPLWNDLLQKIQEIKIIELFKTGLNRTELFKTNSICFYLQNSYYLLLLLFHVYQRQEITPRNFWFPNAEHRRLFKIKNKQKINNNK